MLLFGTDIQLGRIWKAEKTIIVDRISRVAPFLVRFPEMRKVGCKGITVKEDGMMRVHSTYGIVDAIIKSNHACVGGISGLVEWIVPRDPCVVAVVFRKFLPKPNNTVLEVFVKPERCDVSPMVGVPVCILSTR